MNSALLRLAAALFIWGLGEGTFFFFQPLYLEELGADPFQIGKILGGVGIAMTIVHIPAGYLADKIGRRPLLRLSWTIGLLSSIMMASASTLPFFVIALIFYSLTTFVISPLNSYVTAARGKWTVERAITLISATFSLGMVSGPMIGGWLGDHFGLRSLYIAAVVVFTISTILVYSLPSQPLHHSAKEFSPKSLLQNKRYLSFLILIFFVVFALYLPQPLTQNFLQGERGLSLSQIGILGSLSGIGNVVLNLLLGQLGARVGFLIAQLATALFAFLIWRGSGMGIYSLAYFLLGGYRAARSLAAAHVNSLIDDAQMGLAYGITETASAFPMILAPPLAGYLYTSDPASPYPFSLLLIFSGVILTLFFFPRSANE
ncbi:MAG: MFS transporter [Anaerolineae bacterium]|jgi:MFS family permease|nr:MFS transporter [Anaerolineae bacterium]MBT7071217.1 MFS transporter [Anaerolineae bacterium]MBT7324200.1 MFS transporter [Anaerolineae bacterium]